MINFTKNLVSVNQMATQKSCSRDAIIKAIENKEIDAEEVYTVFGYRYAIDLDNEKNKNFKVNSFENSSQNPAQNPCCNLTFEECEQLKRNAIICQMLSEETLKILTRI